MTTRSFVSVAGAALLALVSLGEEPPKSCCFENSAYSGVCQVSPGDGETCASILEYLNTPNSTGKGYCSGTTVRGGWKEAACGPAPQAERIGPVGAAQKPRASDLTPAKR